MASFSFKEQLGHWPIDLRYEIESMAERIDEALDAARAEAKERGYEEGYEARKAEEE